MTEVESCSKGGLEGRVFFYFFSFATKEKEILGSGGIPQGVWMCGVGCHPIHRGKPLRWVMSPLQGRYGVLSPQRRVSTLRFVILPLQGIDNPDGV